MPRVAERVAPYGTRTIAYAVERKKRLKNTYIEVDKEGVLIRTNEQTSDEELEAYIIKKASWIGKHLQGYKARNDEELVTGSRLYYLGRSYYVELNHREVDEVSVAFVHAKFTIEAPLNVSQMALQQAVDTFYKEKAMKKIDPLVKKWSKLMEVDPEYVGYRKAEKRWGSCSPSNRISFNYHLMKLSSSLIEYVVIHELAHIRHKNHSKDFWAEVKRFLPEYRSKDEKIKGFEKLF